MNKVKKYLLLAAGVVLLATTLSTTKPAPVLAQAPRAPRGPIQVTGFATVNQGLTTIFTVPPTKRLVIEYVSADAPVTPGVTKAHLLVRTTVGSSGPLPHFFVLTEQETLGGVTHLFTSQPVRLYADPGTDVEVQYSCAACPPNFGTQVVLTLSGFLD